MALDHAAAKRAAEAHWAGRRARGGPAGNVPYKRPTRGWRTEWDGAPFPVETRRVTDDAPADVSPEPE